MKPLQKIKDATNKVDAFKAIFSKQEDYDLDEREPMERMADEMEKFSSAIGDMNKKQLEAIANMMKTMISLVETMGKQKDPEPVVVTVQDNRPLAWVVDVSQRDGQGRIEKINLTANKE
jgi:Mg2+ and Co2+ transporter CorA